MHVAEQCVVYPDNVLMSAAQAREHYQLSIRESTSAPPIHNELTEHGVAVIDAPSTRSDYEEFIDAFEECIPEGNEDPQFWDTTPNYAVDRRMGSTEGYVLRKPELDQDGVQTSDGKSYFHFTESSHAKWSMPPQGKKQSKVLRGFLEQGCDIHEQIVRAAKLSISQLEETHPNISSVLFNGSLRERSFSFLRILSYDAPLTNASISGLDCLDRLDPARPHRDISAFTIQGYSNAPGFWGQDSSTGLLLPHPTVDGKGHLFTGRGYEKLYGGRQQGCISSFTARCFSPAQD